MRSEVLRYLFELCRYTPSTLPKGPAVGRWDLANEDPGAADPNLLFDLLYGDSVTSIRHQQLPRNQEPAAVGEQAGQRVKDQDVLMSFPDRAKHMRKDLGRGPLKSNQNLTLGLNREGANRFDFLSPLCICITVMNNMLTCVSQLLTQMPLLQFL